MSEATEKQWPALTILFGGYFHQDFGEIYGGPAQTIEEFKSDGPGDLVSRAALEARTMASSSADEEALRTTVEDLGLSYVPWRDGWTCRSWLEHVADTLTGS